MQVTDIDREKDARVVYRGAERRHEEQLKGDRDRRIGRRHREEGGCGALLQAAF